MAMIKVSTTLWMEAKRKSLELIIVTNSVPFGRSSLMRSNSFESSALTAVAFEPATWKIRKVTAGWESISLRKP